MVALPHSTGCFVFCIVLLYATAMSEAPSVRRRGIQSVEIGMRVLTALASLPGPAALSAVAQAAGLSASQTHRYLSSLITAGLARQQAATGCTTSMPGPSGSGWPHSAGSTCSPPPTRR